MGGVSSKEFQGNMWRYISVWGEQKKMMGRKQEKQFLLDKKQAVVKSKTSDGVLERVGCIGSWENFIQVYKLKNLLKLWVDNAAYIFPWLI